MLPYLTIEPKQPADSCVIWLHGLGADGHDFAPIVPELKLPQSLATRFIFPHAPEIPVTINGGLVMPAWYDILEMQLERRVDVHQLITSAEQVVQLIRQQNDQGIPSERIVIAGFSQGGAVAYHAALTHDQPLGGLIALSTYLATSDTIRLTAENQNLPILIMHGQYDDIVPEQLGLRAQEFLLQRGYAVEYALYPMQHAVCQAQIEALGIWLAKRLVVN